MHVAPAVASATIPQHVAPAPHQVEGWIELVWRQPLPDGGHAGWNLGLLANEKTGVLTASATRNEFDSSGRPRRRQRSYGISHAGGTLVGPLKLDAEQVFRSLREVMSLPRSPGFFQPAQGDDFGVVLKNPNGQYREMFPMKDMHRDPAFTAARQALEAAARLAPEILRLPIVPQA